MKIRDSQSIWILVQFGEFKSIDCFQKGFYQIKARLYSKYRSASGLRRIDATIVRHYSATGSELLTDARNNSLQEENQDHGHVSSHHGHVSSPQTCTLPHSICNWRCRQGPSNSGTKPSNSGTKPSNSGTKPSNSGTKPSNSGTKPSYSGTKIPSSWLSEIVFIEHSNDSFSLEESILFKFDRKCKLYPSEYIQNDDLYLDLELFFNENKSSKDGLGPSKQRIILLIPGISKIHQLRQLYHQTSFSGIYSSCLDIYATQMLVESQLSLKREVKTSDTNWPLNSIVTFILATKKSIQERQTGFDSDSISELSVEENQQQCKQSIEDAIMMLMKWLLEIFDYLQSATQADGLPLLLLSDVCLPWKDILQSDELEVVSDLLQKKETIFRFLKEYLQSCNLSMEYGQNILSSLGAICSEGANDVISLSIQKSFNNLVAFRRKVYHDNVATLDQFCLTEKEDDFLKTPFRFNTMQKKIPPIIQFDIAQYWPKIPESTWLIEINKDKPSSLGIRDKNVAHSGLHLIVFVHGLLGHANDLRQFKSKIVHHLNSDPNSDTEFTYLFSKCNQSNTFDHLITMGSKLANEVVEFAQDIGMDKISRISFVGHSLGGLIIRVAIRNERLQELSNHFHSLITFGTPHLSQALNNHMILGAALRLYQSIYSAACIDQLYLNDHEDKRECLLYRLSQDTNLLSFKKIYVFGSEQDQYVHFEGALLSPLCNYKDYSTFDQSLQPIYREMQRNILSNCQSLHRYQLHFEEIELLKKQWGYIGDPLGRNAHIALIVNENAIHLALSKAFFLT